MNKCTKCNRDINGSINKIIQTKDDIIICHVGRYLSKGLCHICVAKEMIQDLGIAIEKLTSVIEDK